MHMTCTRLARWVAAVSEACAHMLEQAAASQPCTSLDRSISRWYATRYKSLCADAEAEADNHYLSGSTLVRNELLHFSRLPIRRVFAVQASM